MFEQKLYAYETLRDFLEDNLTIILDNEEVYDALQHKIDELANDLFAS